MTWRKTKKLLQAKPYLLDPYREMTMKEAKAIWDKRGYPCTEELLEGLRIRMGKSEAEWADMTCPGIKRSSFISSIIRKLFYR